MHIMLIYAKICKMKKNIIILIVTLLTTIMTGCSNKEESDGKIRLGTSPDYPPFEFKEEGKVVGLDIDLVTLIAKHLNKDVEIIEMDFASLIPALQADKIDVIASGLTITKERLENIDFSDTYYHAAIVSITKKDKSINEVADLANKKIGTQLGSIMENFIKEQKNNYPNISIISLANNINLLQELKLGRIDSLLVEEGQIKEILSNNPGLTAKIIARTGDGYALGFAKNSKLTDEFNLLIKELDNLGEINSIKQKWLEVERVKSSGLLKALKYIPGGILVTLQYALTSVFFGLIIGSTIALSRLSNYKPLHYFAYLYLSLFRGTPLLLQLFMIYFALPKVIGIDISAFVAGIIAFSLNSGAYVSENIRAGIESVDKGQFEAAKSLGFSYPQMMKLIIMPQAIRNILPALVNEAINMVKESSIISVLGEADIMRRANVISAEHYSYAEPLMVAAACYYILIMILSFLAKKLERRLKII